MAANRIPMQSRFSMSGLLPGLMAGAGSYVYVWLDPRVYKNGDGLVPWVAVCALGGLLAALLSPAKKRIVLGSVLVGAVGLNLARIVIDTTADPTSHNLFPFELGFTCISTAAGAFAGIVLGRLGKRLWLGPK